MNKMLLILPLTLAAVPANAAEPLPLETRIVATADLDLSTNAGKAALDRRIDRAAAEVCGAASKVDLAGRNDVRACRVETVAKAQEIRDRRIAASSGVPIILAAR